ncbi:hypothetical protein [Luteolibacter sp. Populi]|uniref:hypothetical protein n=1 Tax=Luteolibacter sp. Populi TaxID=3230487 RepID=UPI003466C9B4
MASSGRKVRIQIETKADTKGADETAKSLERVADAQRNVNANPMADGSQLNAAPIQEATAAIEDQTAAVEDATTSAADLAKEQADLDLAQVKAARSAKDQAAALREIRDAGRAMVALQLARHLVSVLDALEDVATESGDAGSALSKGMAAAKPAITTAKVAVDGISVGLAAAVATGNPLIGLIAGIGAEAVHVVQAYKDMNAQLASNKLAQAAAIQQLKDFAEIRKQLAAQIRKEAQEDRFEEERRELAGKTRGLENRSKVGDASTSAAQAAADTAAERAVRNGADPGAIAAGQAAEKLNAAFMALDNVLAVVRSKAEEADAAWTQAETLAHQARQPGAATMEELRTLEKSARDAQEAAAAANDEVDTIAAITEQKKAELKSTVEGELGKLGDAVGGDVTEMANQAITTLETKAAEQGGRLSAEATRVLEQLYQIVSDSIPDETQAGTLASLMSQLRSSQEARDRKIQEGITGLMDAARTSEMKYNNLAAQIRQLSRSQEGPGTGTTANGMIR